MSRDNSHSIDDHWTRFKEFFLRYRDLDFSLDVSRMTFDEGFLKAMEAPCRRAFDAVARLESGALANPDENRMVGHYWLRAPGRAPNLELQQQIRNEVEAIKTFARAVHGSEIAPPGGNRFTHLLLIGIGGSALGPQLVADALTGPGAPMGISYFDNTDPDGMDRVIAQIGDRLPETMTLVISKSGGTRETRNGMLEAEAAYRRRGLEFPAHAVAVTGEGSLLDQQAESQGWLRRFPMSDWVGGRTSVMSVVGLLPAALLGVDIDAFLHGAAHMDEKTRDHSPRTNASMLLALAWHYAGNGRGDKDMVILPYKDRLMLFGKYLQQLVMESLGKELDLDGNVVNQGIVVYGNKGSTDQHAYVQQLRDGVNNFFVTFLEVRKDRDQESIDVDGGTTSGDYLQGFLRGTRAALSRKMRESITISVARVDAYSLGLLIALYERAVSYYAALVHVNAYHQPGVQAGKEAAEAFIALLGRVRAHLADRRPGSFFTAPELAAALDASPEEVYHILNHLEANDPAISCNPGSGPAADVFVKS